MAHISCLAVFGSLCLASVVQAQGYKLSGALAPSPAFGGDVSEASISPDGTRVVFLADQEIDDKVELYSVPLGGGSLVKLSGSLVANGDVESFEISPDGSRVVYIADANPNDVLQLYSAPIDGSSAPIKLNPTPVSGGNVDSFALSPDSSRVVFKADLETDDRYELYSVPADGSSSAVKLNGTLPPSADGVRGYRISSDSTNVVYKADETTAYLIEIFSAPIDGSTGSVKLNGPLTDNEVLSFALTPDGTYVVYQASEGGIPGFFRATIGTSGSSLLLAGITPGTFLPLLLSSDSNWAVYEINGQVFSVPVDGSRGPVQLNGPSGAVHPFLISPDGSRVVYRADQDTDDLFELYSTLIDGSVAAVKVSGPLIADGDVRVGFVITPDSTRVLYRADQETDEIIELYSGPIDGSGSPVKLNATSGVGGGVGLGLSVTPDSARVLFRGNLESEFVFDLYSALVDGASSAVRLSDGLGVAADVTTQTVSMDGTRVVYIADREIDEVFELYETSTTGGASTIKLNGPLPPSSAVDGDVEAYEISPDGAWAVYLADGAVDDLLELYSVPTDGRSPPVRISGVPTTPYDVRDDFWIAPDANTVVYARDGFWYSVPIDGSSSPLLISPLGLDSQFSEAGDFLAYLYQGDVFTVPVDGSSPPALVTGSFPYPISSFRLAPDGTRFAFVRLNARGTFSLETWTAPIDGSQPPTFIGLPGQNSVASMAITPDSSRVIYVGGFAGQGHQVFSGPLDGSASVVALNDPAQGNRLEFSISGDSDWVVFYGDQDDSTHEEIYTVPADGSATPVRLNPPVGIGEVHDDYAISPDSRFVVYRIFDLYSSPIDGGQPAVSLAPPGSYDFEITSSGGHVVYRANTGQELLRVPTDGSEPPVLLAATSVVGIGIYVFHSSLDEERVVFEAASSLRTETCTGCRARAASRPAG